MVKIAIAQVQSSPDKGENLKNALRLIGHAKRQDAELIAFPEFLMAFSPSSQSAAELAAVAESLEGPFIAALRESAREANLGVLAAIYETSPITDRVYDTAVWLDTSGNISSIYRKLHLYDAFGFKESDKFHPGADIAPLVNFGDAHCGTMICYDLRFPELARIVIIHHRLSAADVREDDFVRVGGRLCRHIVREERLVGHPTAGVVLRIAGHGIA